MATRRLSTILLALGLVAVSGCNLRITDGHDDSFAASLSGDGRHVLFHSLADLTPDDDNEVPDAYIWHRDGNRIELLPAGPGSARWPSAISEDGNAAVLTITGYEWSPGEPLFDDLFIWQRDAGMTRITRGSGSTFGVDMSHDGRYVTFATPSSLVVSGDTNGRADVFVWERATGTTTRITDGDGHSVNPTVSGDGRYVAFESEASDLAPGDANGVTDVFVFDRATSTTTRISSGAGPSRDPDMAGGGRYVAYGSLQSDLVADDDDGLEDVMVWDRATGATTRTEAGNTRFHLRAEPSLSRDGRFMVFTANAGLRPADDNGWFDVYRIDHADGTLVQLTDGNGPAAGASISGDGRTVAFTSPADDIAPLQPEGDEYDDDVFVWADPAVPGG